MKNSLDTIKSIATLGIRSIDLFVLVKESKYKEKDHELMMKILNDYANFLRLNNDLNIRIEGSEIYMDNLAVNDVVTSRQFREIVNDIVKEFNLERIIDRGLQTVNSLDGKKRKKKGTIDGVLIDWMLNFTNLAENITDEMMIDYCSKLLANEILHPGSISIRTLDVLKKMTTDDAIKFENICGKIFNEKYIFDFEINPFDFINDYIIDLQDVGLVSQNLISVKSTDDDYLVNEEYSINCRPYVSQLDLKAYALTHAGQQLLKFFNKKGTNLLYIQMVCYCLMKTYPEIILAIHPTKGYKGFDIPDFLMDISEMETYFGVNEVK